MNAQKPDEEDDATPQEMEYGDHPHIEIPLSEKDEVRKAEERLQKAQGSADVKAKPEIRNDN